MKRLLLVTAIAAAGLLGVGGPAQADPPPLHSGSFVLTGTATAGTDGFCPFDVRLDYVTHQRTTETTNADGAIVDYSTGAATATVTNTSSGKSLTYNISGPGTLTTYPDHSFTEDNMGPFLLFTTVANSYPGVPALAYTTGHVQLAVAASQLTTSYRLQGHSTDVCAALG